MSIRLQSRPKHLHSSTYKPRFQNPDPLPSIDEFKLDHILTKTLARESASVAVSLSRVAANYQQDLKGEIRKALAIEQRIQNKNIHAIERAHRLTKQWRIRQKLLGKVSGNKGEPRNSNSAKENGLGSEIDKLLKRVIDVSASVKSLLTKASEISVKKGGQSMPDPVKYPLLNKLLWSMSPGDDAPGQKSWSNFGNSLRNLVANDTAIADRGLDLLHRDAPEMSAKDLNNNTDLGKQPSQKLLKDFNSSDFEGNSSSYSQFYERLSEHTSKHSLYHENTIETSENDTQGGNSSADHDEATFTKFDEDPAMHPDAFELFMATSIAKYREKVDEKHKAAKLPNLDHKKDSLQRSRNPLQRSRNPLRLLSSGPLNAKMQSVNMSPFTHQDDTFRYPFLCRKSAATVLETPELSLHKKLRISVLPASSKSQESRACECQNLGQDSSCPKTAGESDVHDAGGLWFVSGSPLETGTASEAESVSGVSSSSDASSDSQSGHIAETNSYYLMRQTQMNLKLRSGRRARHKKRVMCRTELSLRPKHQPLHRLLQPKQSILKLAKAKNEVALEVENQRIEEEISPVSLAYAASPRASFVSEVAVPNLMLQSKTEEEADGRARPNSGQESDGPRASLEQEESQAINTLKRLMI